MSNYLIGADAKPVAIVPVVPKVNFLQRPAFGGMRVWQAGLGGAGLALILGGLVTLIVRKK